MMWSSHPALNFQHVTDQYELSWYETAWFVVIGRPFNCIFSCEEISCNTATKLETVEYDCMAGDGEKYYKCYDCGERFRDDGRLQPPIVVLCSGEQLCQPWNTEGSKHCEAEASYQRGDVDKCQQTLRPQNGHHTQSTVPSTATTGSSSMAVNTAGVVVLWIQVWWSICRQIMWWWPRLVNKCWLINAATQYLSENVQTGEKPYGCIVCGQKFIQSSHIGRPSRLYSGDKPCMYNVWTDIFLQSSILTTHARLHTVDEPYECTISYKFELILCFLNFVQCWRVY